MRRIQFLLQNCTIRVISLNKMHQLFIFHSRLKWIMTLCNLLKILGYFCSLTCSQITLNVFEHSFFICIKWRRINDSTALLIKNFYSKHLKWAKLICMWEIFFFCTFKHRLRTGWEVSWSVHTTICFHLLFLFLSLIEWAFIVRWNVFSSVCVWRAIILAFIK